MITSIYQPSGLIAPRRGVGQEGFLLVLAVDNNNNNNEKIYIYIYTHMYVCMHIYIYIYIYTCMYTLCIVWPNTVYCACIYTYIYIYIHIHMCIHICIYICIYIYMYACVCTYIHIHSQVQYYIVFNKPSWCRAGRFPSPRNGKQRHASDYAYDNFELDRSLHGK